MKKIILGSAIVVAIVLVCLPKIVHGETYVRGILYGDTVWDMSGSPYIIDDDIEVHEGSSLTIKEGVKVEVAEVSTAGIFIDGARFNIMGTGRNRVSLKRISGITIINGEAVIVNADIDDPDGLVFENSRGIIATSTITHAGIALNLHDSAVSVWGSRIEKNANGIVVQPSGAPVLMRANISNFGTGGIGNALDSIPETRTYLNISGSVIANNERYGSRNMSTTTVQETNDWWGSPNGPAQSGSNSIDGLAVYDPWLMSDPPLDPGTDIECCSSILFIPGLEATRLYRNESGILGGTSTNQLWEPNRNADVTKLYLDKNGSSTDPNIFSGGPIGSAFGIADVYGKFTDFLDGLVRQKTINGWKAFGYDWRKPISEVVAGSERKATTTEALIDTVAELAANSKTEKVTLIAHSNGGLVAKYLVKTLTDLGKENLIDKVISVAVPYLGTPEAIPSLLHGDHQAIGYGLIETKSVARGLGANMTSAYSLLPSREYFSRIFSPTIAFASSSVNGVNDGSYPKAADTYDKQSVFITDAANSRKDPAFKDTSLPIKGNDVLMAAADVLHGILDPFSWPTTITRWAIIGWGNPTTKSLAYSGKSSCWKQFLGMKCGSVAVHEASTTLMGDGTVMAPSAAYNSGTALSLDLVRVSHDEKSNTAHMNILEASSTQTAINSIIRSNSEIGNDSTNGHTINDELSKIPGISIGEPDYNNEPTLLVVRTHSPVELHVYDSQGNHTGLIALPDTLNGSDSFYQGMFEEKIPGSKFDTMGGTDDDPETQIYLPDDPGQKYSISIQGIGVGEFSYDVERRRGDQTIEKIEFADMPVTPLTIATSTVTAKLSNGSYLSLASTSAAVLSIDVDGDGMSDIQAGPHSQFDPIMYLESLKKTISMIAGTIQRGKSLIKRIDRIEELIKKGKFKRAGTITTNLANRVEHKILRKISENDRRQILDMLEMFVAQLE